MAQHRWVIWRLIDGRKVPFQALRPHRYASVTNPETWSKFEHAMYAAISTDGGLGFVLTDGEIAAVDLDDRIHSGHIDDWAKAIVDDAEGAYIEKTPSGRGLRIIGRATGPRVHCKFACGNGSVEVYRRAERYITITGQQVGRCARLPFIDDLIDDLATRNHKPTRTAIDVEININGLDWREILRRYGLRHLTSYVTQPVPGPTPERQGKRSEVIWRLLLDLREKGATPSEAACVAWHSEAWKSKHGDNMLHLRKEVARAFK
jgi:hypothetical protein